MRMRIVVVGATGNVGSAVLRALARSPEQHAVVGVARRPPVAGVTTGAGWAAPGTVRWVAADISRDPLHFVEGADAVVHLAWRIQPAHDEATMRATNVTGTVRLVEHVLHHRVPRLVYASSVGTYAPSTKRPLRSEAWPATGVRTSTYSRHKAEVEAHLDGVERTHPEVAVVRMRTSLVFQRQAASEIHRLFLGPMMPWHVPRALRLIPRLPRLQFQATHADDIADAYVRAIERDVRGAFNVAAEPVLTPESIAAAVGGRTVPFPERALRALVSATFAARVQRSEAGWLDMATLTPIMDTTRARDELGWVAHVTATDALVELLDGIGDGAGDRTPALVPRREAGVNRAGLG